jgi:hypothetical protein
MIRASPLAGPLSVAAWYYVTAGAALAVGGTLGGSCPSTSARGSAGKLGVVGADTPLVAGLPPRRQPRLPGRRCSWEAGPTHPFGM